MITLVQKFGASVMMIYNAILAEKRVLFLGFGCSAGEVCLIIYYKGCHLHDGISLYQVCNYVLASCCMVCPPLTGLIGRVFPYTNLCYLDFLSVYLPRKSESSCITSIFFSIDVHRPGYITGVTNPMFEEHPEWWDLLCNIQTGKVTLNPSLVQDVPEKYVVYLFLLLFVTSEVMSYSPCPTLVTHHTRHILH